MTGLFLAAWIGHTDASREMAQDLIRAFQLAGLKHETVASLMGLTPPQLGHQLAGAEPLNLFRLSFLPGAFHLAWLQLHAQRIGAEVLTADQVSYLKAAAIEGPRKMIKAGLRFMAGLLLLVGGVVWIGLRQESRELAELNRLRGRRP